MKFTTPLKGSNVQGRRKRIQILEAAGEAFAAHGYAATSVRDIATVAGVQPSALIYHFQSKKALFQAVLNYHIIENPKFMAFFESFKNLDNESPQSMSDAMVASVKVVMHACHGPTGRIKNFKGLMVALVTEGGIEANKVARERVTSAMAAAFKKFQKVNPELANADLFWWSHLFWGLILYTIFGEVFLLAETGSAKYTHEFIDTLAWRIAKACCVSQGLPLPTGGDLWKHSEYR